VTVQGVYHADPHRGNVLLLEDGRLALVDFGLLGRLDEDTRRTLRRVSLRGRRCFASPPASVRPRARPSF